MGNKQSYIKKVNFEDIQEFIKKKMNNCILINTLNKDEQSCLINGTILVSDEEKIINSCLKKRLQEKINIIIYDKNSHQQKLLEKYEQLNSLGFLNVYMYTGGLFEWLLLQDIYGTDEFPTTSSDLHILNYKAPSAFKNKLLLENI